MEWYFRIKLIEQVAGYAIFGMILLILVILLILAAFEGWRDECRRKRKRKGAGK